MNDELIPNDLRLVRLIACGLQARELQVMTRGLEAFELASRLGVNTQGMRYESQAISSIYANWDSISSHFGILPPEWPAPIEHPVCPGIPEAMGLRWRDLPVSVSYDRRRACPVAQRVLNPESITQLTREWTMRSSLETKYVEYLPSKSNFGDVHIMHAALPDNTLGLTYQPRGNNSTFMDEAGNLSGDILIDNDREWLDWGLLLTLLHELGHAWGLGHSPNPSDVMFAQLTRAGARALSAGDTAMIQVPYPVIPDKVQPTAQ